jgi:RNA polymerase sigma-70 factor, ECF subfamily
VSPTDGGQEQRAAADRPSGDEDRFRSIFESRYPAISSYVLRRIGAGPDVADVTAQVFEVAWQRRSRLPDPPGDLPWLYGVARKMVARHWRSQGRRRRLEQRLTSEAVLSSQDSAHPVTDLERVEVALGRLRSADQEVLRLIHWEELSQAEAGAVLGCSANAVAIRLLRARARLNEQMDKVGGPPTDTTRPPDPGAGKGGDDGSR